jgi:cellulose synthase/poly-beta-1,6-N-acetylglucosamine synthase-like glycosyltransferase
LRLDADTLLPDNVPQAIAAIRDSGADLCSVKVEVANRVSVAAKLQALEYRIAMLGRHIRPWLTSGACLIGKTTALREIFESHSMWSPGEDIETGRAAHALRMRIRHCDIVVQTDAPVTWRALVKQRRLWWAGNFRHFVVNADRNLLHLPVLTLYTLVVIWLSISTRWWSAMDVREFVALLPVLLVSYTLVTAVCNLQVLSPWMLLFPFYAFAQTLVMPLLGLITYVKLARRQGLGRYRFGYRRGRPRAVVVANPARG